MVLYWPAVVVIALVAAGRGLRAPREGLIGLIAFATLCLSAVRWDLIPLPGLGVLFLLSTLGAASFWLILRATSGEREATGPGAVPPYLLALTGLLAVVLVGSLPLLDPTRGIIKGAGLLLRGVAGAMVLAAFGRLSAKDASAAASGVLVGATLAALALVGSGTVLTERASISDSTNPITVGRIIGLGAIVAFTRTLAGPRGMRFRAILYAALGLLLLLASMLTGSRGPVLASLIGLTCALLFLPSEIAPRSLRVQRVLFTLAMAAVVAVAFAPRLLALGGVARVVETLSNLGANHTEVERIEYYRRAVRALPANAIAGAGPGSFEVLSNGRAKFPHNLELELLVELGLPGALLGGALLTIPAVVLMVRAHRQPFSTDELILAGLWVASILNAQVSGDIATNSNVWITGALVVLLLQPGKVARASA